jgi:hypothetical protein
MRTVTGAVTFLTLAFLSLNAQPASSSEVFVAQVTNKTMATEQAAIASAKSVVSSELLALPVKLNAAGLPLQTAAGVGANTSVLVQTGSNNLAAVAQSGGENASTLVQHGNGNQAVVTQRH